MLLFLAGCAPGVSYGVDEIVYVGARRLIVEYSFNGVELLENRFVSRVYTQDLNRDQEYNYDPEMDVICIIGKSACWDYQSSPLELQTLFSQWKTR